MKIKHYFVGALLLLMTAPSFAQNKQVDPLQEQVSAIIKSGAPDAAKQVLAVSKEHKKEPLAQVSIAKAYLVEKDYTNAKLYGEKALEIVNKKATPQEKSTVYLLLGNIAVGMDEGGEAASWFQQAIYADKTNPDGYRRYAQIMSKTDPAGAVQTLEDLRAARPDYPVDLIAADIASQAGKMKQAIQYYGKVQLSDMDTYQLSDYATNLFLSSDYQKSLEVATFGQNKEPRNASMNRLVMFNQTSLKNYDAALVAADKLFNASDSAKISSFDQSYYASALQGAKKYQEAIDVYTKLQGMEGVGADVVSDANKSISDCYKELGNYGMAGDYYDKYLKAQKQVTAYAMSNLASIYLAEANDAKTPAAKKAESLAKADAVYAEMQQKFPSVADYAVLQRAHLPFVLDPEDKAGKAQPFYAELVEVVNAKAEKGDAETKKLKEAYNYLQIYYFKIANDTPKAKEYAAKLLEIDPENATAKTIAGL